MTIQVADVRHNVQSKNYSQETYKSLSPITWLLNLFSINCNCKGENYKNTRIIPKYILTTVFLGGLDVYSLYYKYVDLYPHNTVSQSIRLTDTMQMIFDFCQYLVDLWFVYKYGKSISLEYFQQYSFIDPILNMTAYSKIKYKVARLLGFFSFIWVVSSVSDFVAWYYTFGWLTPTMYAVAYIFLYIKILTTLDLSSHVMHIEERLKIIGDVIHHYYLISEELPGLYMGDFISNKNWFYSKACASSTTKHLNPMKFQSADECDKIKWLTRCYLQLTEQVEFINCMFGFRILLNSTSLLIDVIRFTNLAIRIALGTQTMPQEIKYFAAAAIMMRQLSCILVLVNLVHHCGKAYAQRDRILNTIDHLLINKKPSEKLRTVMNEFRGLVQDRPIDFNLAKFFTLNRNFLVSIASVVVTYTIILLQSMN